MSTLREVAALAGVSTATVSRVFSRPEAVTEETRERVLAAARGMDYSPNPVARSLARGRTGNLGLLVPDINNPVFGSVINDVQEHAQQNGHVVFVAAGNGRAEDEFALVQAIGRQVDGMVLTAPRMADEDLAAVAKLAPVALINRSLPGAPSVNVPSGDGMGEAVDHLVDLGHRRLHYVGGPATQMTQRNRLSAFRATCARRGVEGVVVTELPPDFTRASEALAGRLVAEDAQAIVAYNDQAALGIMKGLVRHGRRAAREFSIVGFDDSWLTEMIDPPLTSVRMPFAAAARTATQLLLDLLEGKELGEAASVELATHLIVRSSTAPPRAVRGHTARTDGGA